MVQDVTLHDLDLANARPQGSQGKEERERDSETDRQERRDIDN